MRLLNLVLDIVLPKKEPLSDVTTERLAQVLREKPSPNRTPANWIDAGFPYHDPDVRRLVLHLKKYRDARVAAALAERLADVVAEREAEHYVMSGGGPTVLVPIPLHHTQLRSRGFNQSALLATALSRGHSHRKVLHALHATSHHKKQALLGRQERIKNIVGTLARNRKRLPDRALVIIIDDVTTTGATLHEARLQFAGEIPPHRLLALTVAH